MTTKNFLKTITALGFTPGYNCPSGRQYFVKARPAESMAPAQEFSLAPDGTVATGYSSPRGFHLESRAHLDHFEDSAAANGKLRLKPGKKWENVEGCARPPAPYSPAA